VNFHDRVLIARRPPIPGPPFVGTAIGRCFTPSGDALDVVLVDAPTPDGRAMLDCSEHQLLVLPRTRPDLAPQDGPVSR
jgi:hypothetical protein